MAKAWTEKEIYLTTKNEVGCMSKWTGQLAEAGINVWAACGWTEGDDAKFAFLTDNNTKALETLTGSGYTTDEHDVLVVELEDKPGAIAEVGTKLSTAGIDGKYMYVSTCGGCTKTRAVLGTTDNTKAVTVLG